MDTLISDCDGVLVNTEAVSEKVLLNTLEKLFPEEDITSVLRPLLGFRIDDTLTLVSTHFGQPINPGLAQELRVDIERRLMEDMPLVEGVGTALRAVPLVKKAVVSNSTVEHIRRAVRANGLEDVFGDNLFTANMVGRPKPAPDIYLHAAVQLGSDPTQCIVIEDSVAGVTASVAAGMSVIGFVGGEHVMHDQAERLRALGAVMIIDRMDKLVDTLRDMPAMTRG